MKPFGREKKITGGVPWKIDRHFNPKHLIRNWWEDMCDYLPRTTINRNTNKEIEEATLDYLKFEDSFKNNTNKL